MEILKKIKENTWILRSIFKTIWFNFHYLPFKQAIKLPILLYNAKLLKCNGVIRIEGEIRRGMIVLGRIIEPSYPNTGFIFQNSGGTIIFKGQCLIAHGSALTIGRSSTISFGEDFRATAAVKIISHIGIDFGVKARIGWDCLIMDTSFHPLYDMEKGVFKKAYGKIKIGDYNWFGNQCVIMHSVQTPERCIFGLRTVITRGGKYESYAVHGGSPVKVLSRSVMRDYENDRIKEYI